MIKNVARHLILVAQFWASSKQCVALQQCAALLISVPCSNEWLCHCDNTGKFRNLTSIIAFKFATSLHGLLIHALLLLSSFNICCCAFSNSQSCSISFPGRFLSCNRKLELLGQAEACCTIRAYTSVIRQAKAEFAPYMSNKDHETCTLFPMSAWHRGPIVLNRRLHELENALYKRLRPNSLQWAQGQRLWQLNSVCLLATCSNAVNTDVKASC